MKKLFFILIFITSYSTIHCYADSNNTNFHSDNSNSSKKLLVQESILCIKKHAWLIALTPIILYYHSEILNIVTNQPYLSSVALYLCLHYCCDTILSYKEQLTILTAIELIKKIALYLAISHGLKNHISQNATSLNFRNEDSFALSKMLSEDLPCPMHEFTLLITESYRQLKKNLHALNKNITIESEEIIFLSFESSITLNDLLYLTETDEELYSKIYDLKTQKNTALQPILDCLRLGIITNLQNLQHLNCPTNLPGHS